MNPRTACPLSRVERAMMFVTLTLAVAVILYAWMGGDKVW